MLQQFPSEFEYTSQLLVLLLQASHSGFFTSFRCNSERERLLFMSKGAMTEALSNLELQHSSVFCYVLVLLASPGAARMLVNPMYAQAGGGGGAGERTCRWVDWLSDDCFL